MLSDEAAVHCALLIALVKAVCWAFQRPTSGNICGETPFATSSSDVLVNPFSWATASREDSPAADCASVTEMPFEAATWFITSNLISQLRTSVGISAVVIGRVLPYGFAASCRL